MKKLLAALALCLASVYALAEIPAALVAESPDKSTRITIFTSPCEGAVVALIPAQYLPKMQKATVVFKGKTLEACWTLLPTGTVGIIDEEGDQGEISVSLFKPQLDV